MGADFDFNTVSDLQQIFLPFFKINYSLFCFTDTVCSGLYSHQPVLLHGKVRLPGSHVDPPHLGVRCLLLPPFFQLLGAGLHKGQTAPCHRGQAKTERFS